MLRILAIVLATVLVTTSCAHRADMPREQRRECRRLRTKAVFRGVGLTVGVAVVATVLVVAVAASRGSLGNGGGSSGRGQQRRRERRERRRARHQVCFETMERAPARSRGPIVEAPPAPAAPPIASTPAPPPSEDQLVATFEGIEDDVRECLGVGEVVEIDVSIDGRSGQVTGYALHGMVASSAQSRCLGEQLTRMRFQPFHDELRVRFALDLGWVPPPPGSQS